MAKTRRRPRPVRNPDATTLVRALRDFDAMTSAQYSLSSSRPPSYHIRAGTTGILLGPCCGAPHLWLVEFECGASETVGVEVWPNQIEVLSD